MSDKRVFRLVHRTARANCIEFISRCPDGMVVSVKPPTRSLEQNAKFHAICYDIARSDAKWAGKRRSAAEWKVLLVSGHAVATKEGSEVVPGLEGEFINLRESTALMSTRRSSSLIEYALAFCAANEIETEEACQ
jgi:hypothetical protein